MECFTDSHLTRYRVTHSVGCMSRRIRLAANGRVVVIDSTHVMLNIRPSVPAWAFIGRKDARGFDRPAGVQFLVTEIATMRWKKGWLSGDRLLLDVPGNNDPWKSKKKHVSHKINLPKKGRKHAIGIELAWAIHLSNIQQTRRSPLVGNLPPREPIPPTWWEELTTKVSARLNQQPSDQRG